MKRTTVKTGQLRQWNGSNHHQTIFLVLWVGTTTNPYTAHEEYCTQIFCPMDSNAKEPYFILTEGCFTQSHVISDRDTYFQ